MSKVKFSNPFQAKIQEAKRRAESGEVSTMSFPTSVTLTNPDIFFAGGVKTAELSSKFIEKVTELIEKAEEEGRSYASVFYAMVRKTKVPMDYDQIAYIVDRCGYNKNLIDIYVKTQPVERARFYAYGKDNPEMRKYMSKYDTLGENMVKPVYDATNFLADFIDEYQAALDAPLKVVTQQPKKLVKSEQKTSPGKQNRNTKATTAPQKAAPKQRSKEADKQSGAVDDFFDNMFD